MGVETHQGIETLTVEQKSQRSDSRCAAERHCKDDAIANLVAEIHNLWSETRIYRESGLLKK
jgi:hypothetical protein